jgi:DNA (cytosine-5)-methyltransferase 1
MMGLDLGHVTAVPGLSRNAQLGVLGNGVVPQQGAAALRLLLATETQEHDGGGRKAA